MNRKPVTTEKFDALCKEGKEGWEYAPLVKLGKLLESMLWFSGVYHISKASYEAYRSIPELAVASFEYREYPIVIDCIWETKHSHWIQASNPTCEHPGKFAIGVREPYSETFQKVSYRRGYERREILFKHSLYYSKAIDLIEDAVYAAEEVIDKRIEAAEKEREEIAKLEALKDRLRKSLDISLVRVQVVESQEFRYRKGCDYFMNFAPLDSEGSFFKICQIGGKYTEEEIKKIIEIVGGNPRAVVERLMGRSEEEV